MVLRWGIELACVANFTNFLFLFTFVFNLRHDSEVQKLYSDLRKTNERKKRFQTTKIRRNSSAQQYDLVATLA